MALGGFEPRLLALDALLRRSPDPRRGTPDRSSAEVSVVVQGPVVGGPDEPADQRVTKLALDSARAVYPDAEIILSTYVGTDSRGLDADHVIFSEDPGPVPSRDQILHIPNNVNRQIVTTRAGLKKASRPLAMKLRSDMLVVHDAPLTLFGSWPARADSLRLLSERVLVPTKYSFNPRRVFADYRFLYAVSDWCHFGTRADLLDLWSAPSFDSSFEWLLGRRVVASEQWLWMSFLNRHDAGAAFDRPDALQHSELSIANNAILLEVEDLGVAFTKFVPSARIQMALYTHGEWLRLYRRYCSGQRAVVRDAQGGLRALVDRLWIQGLSPRLLGNPADDDILVPRPVVPAVTGGSE